jgi:hypothetical protein
VSFLSRTVAILGALSVVSVVGVSVVGAADDGPGPSVATPVLPSAVASTDPSAAPAVTVPRPVAGWWRSDLNAIPLGTAKYDNRTATALARQWSHYGQGEEQRYGFPVVASARQDGLPAPPAGGDRTLRLAHAARNPASQRKLYKSFSAASFPSGREPFNQWGGSPRDVSGRYIVYEYISSRQLHLTERGWINLAQLKEGYGTSDGRHTSDPSWWLVLYDRRGQLMLDLAHWKEGRISNPAVLDMRPYLNKWLKIELRVIQGDRIEVYLNDVLVDIGRQAQYPVGRMHHVGERLVDDGAKVTREEGWIFGVGNYSNPEDPASSSLVHVGLTTVLPLP